MKYTIKKRQGRTALGMLLTVALGVACDAEQFDEYLDQAFAGSDVPACATNPTVYVMAREDQYDNLTHVLDTASIAHARLPTDVSPFTLNGAILFGSNLAGTDAYDSYMETYAAALYDFVDAANLLI